MADQSRLTVLLIITDLESLEIAYIQDHTKLIIHDQGEYP